MREGPCRMGLYLEAGRGREGATRHEIPLPFDLHHTHATGAARRQPIVVAQGRNLNASPPGGEEQRLAILRLNRATVDIEFHQCALKSGAWGMGLGAWERPLPHGPSYSTEIACRLHTSTQVLHATHRSGMIWCGLFGDPMMASDGHAFTHRPHPRQSSSSISYTSNSRQALAVHCLSYTCSSYSCRNQRNVLSTGLGADCPGPQRLVSLMTLASCSRFITLRNRSSDSKSCSLRRFLVRLSRISSIRRVPSRQGIHLPQLSRWMKSMKYFATSTMQLPSSITTRPPEPIIAPTFFSDS